MKENKRKLLDGLKEEMDDEFKKSKEMRDEGHELSEQFHLGRASGLYTAILKIRRLRT